MKVYRVGILTEQFINWGGGIDFIRLIIKGLIALNSDKNSPEVILYVLIPKSKKFIIKFKNTLKYVLNFFFNNKFVLQINIENEQILKTFKDVDNRITICYYTNLNSSLKKQVLNNQIDFIIPTFVPLSKNFPVHWVGYLYDFQHKYYPQFFSFSELKRRDKVFSFMLNSAEIVIVNAKTVSKDIQYFIGKTNAKVVALPFCPVLNTTFFNLNVELDKYQLPEKYFMISNQFWKHKDHVTAFKGYKLFLDGQSDKNICLVCTGKTQDSRFPNYFQEILDLINDLDLKKNIFILGYIPKNDQLQILKNSLALIQPTLFEGGPGGFAVYESVAYGIPSIVSDIPVNKEIEDETLTFFKTGSPEDLAKKMKAISKKQKKVYSAQELIEKNNKSLIKLGGVLINTFPKNHFIN